MLSKEKEILMETLYDSDNYFIPYSINGNWDDLGAIDRVKLCMLLDERNFSFCCCYDFVNGPIWSIQFTFNEPQNPKIFTHSNKSSFPPNNIEKINTIEIYVTNKEIKTLRKLIFFNDTTNIWNNLE